jgi:predicted amidophosphoribosyltransferase
VVRAAIVAHKERGRGDLRAVLAAALARSLDEAARATPAPLPADLRPDQPADLLPVLVPVPSSPSATRRRGADPTRALVVAAARRAGLDRRVAPALRLGRPVADQAGLGARDRSANLAGAFAVRRRWAQVLPGATVVIVDDVVTTGATLTEAARVVRTAGATVVTAAVVAATRRRRDR